MAKAVEETIAVPIVEVAIAPTYDEIAERAYFIYQARGSDHGRDVEDWLQAEAELVAVARAEN